MDGPLRVLVRVRPKENLHLTLGNQGPHNLTLTITSTQTLVVSQYCLILTDGPRVVPFYYHSYDLWTLVLPHYSQEGSVFV